MKKLFLLLGSLTIILSIGQPKISAQEYLGDPSDLNNVKSKLLSLRLLVDYHTHSLFEDDPWLKKMKEAINWLDQAELKVMQSGDDELKYQIHSNKCEIRGYLAIKYEYEVNEAVKVCEKTISYYPDRNFMGLVNAYNASGDLDKLQTYLEGLQQSDNEKPIGGAGESYSGATSFMILSSIGDIFLKKQQFDKAYTTFKEINSDYHADYGMAYSLIGLGKLKEAESYLLERVRHYEGLVGSLGYGKGINLGFGSEGVMESFQYEGLELVKVKQNKAEEAFEYEERSRSIGLIQGILGENVSPLSFVQIQEIVKKQNATFVVYSHVGYGKNILFVYVIQPNGNLIHHSIDLDNLEFLDTTSSDKTKRQNFVSRGAFKQHSQLILIALIFTGGTIVSLILFRKYPRKLTSAILISLSLSTLPLFLANQRIFTANQNPSQSDKLASSSVSNRGTDENGTPKKLKLSDLTRTTFARTRSGSRGIISEQISNKGACQDQDDCLGKMYQLLIQPIEQYLPQEPDAEVVFLPDGDLYKVPFSALKDKNGKYLIEKYTIRHSPSIQLTQILSQLAETSSNSNKAVVVGNPLMPFEIHLSYLSILKLMNPTTIDRILQLIIRAMMTKGIISFSRRGGLLLDFLKSK